MKRKIYVTIIFLLAVAASAHGQGFGAIVGTVTDPSGAVIPAATVTLRQTATGLQRSAVTNAEGYYVIPSLPPSNYDMEVNASGFQSFFQKGIGLQADQSLTVNAPLQTGSVVESIAVEAALLQVNTSTAELSQVVDEKRMADLPLNGRNAAELTLLVAGAAATPANGVNQGATKTFPQGVTISTNGSRQSEISYYLDGGNNEDEYTNINQPFPFPDSLQEFSVQTSNYSARYGQNAGGVVNVITKSGTNEYHGDAFEFVRNAAFNARNYFASDRDQLKRNQFGGTIGGPVQRDRTFFFAGYQRTAIRNTSVSNATVPTTSQLNGDFSALLDANDPNNPQHRVVNIVDPTTGRQFPGNRIPVDRFDQAALSLAKLLPVGGGSGQIFYVKPLTQDFNEAPFRVDHSFSSHDQLTGRYFYDRFTQAPQLNPNNYITYSDSSTIVSHNALLHETHLFNAALLNDTRFSYSRVGSNRAPPPGTLGMRDLGVNIYDAGIKGIQSIAARGFFSIGDDPPAQFVRNSFAWSDDVSWIHSGHSFYFGGSFDRSRIDIRNKTNTLGGFTFTSDVTNYALASFLLGYVRQFVQGSGQFIRGRDSFFGVYFQDDVRISRRLTLNVGLRYEPYIPWRSLDGRVMEFNPRNYYSGATSNVFVNAPPGLVFPGDPGVPQWGTTGDYRDIAPRLGFAYDVFGDGKTSLRGGGGIFYDSRVPGIVLNPWGSTTPFSTTLNVTQPKGTFSNPYLGMMNPFPAPAPPPRKIAFPQPVSVFTFDPNSKLIVPQIYNWNFTLERQIQPSWLARVGYVGSRARHLQEYIQFNPAVYAPGDNRPVDQRRVFQPFGLVGMYLHDVDSSYHALQASLEKRLSHGFTILANYTYSKSLDNTPYNQNVVSMNINLPDLSAIPWNMPDRHRMDYGPSNFDRTHRFVASYAWRLPTLTGRGRFSRSLVGGWEITGVLTAQTGGPLTILAGVDQSRTGLNADRAVLTGAPYGGNACGSMAPCVNYLNPNSFQLPAVGTFGTLGKGSLRGPGRFVWDTGIFKSILLPGERYRLQFRAEFFNVLNHTNFNDPNNSVSGAIPGQIVGAADPRIGQMALKLIF